MMPVWQMMLAGLLRTESPLCSLCFHYAVRPATASSLPSHGWWTGQMVCGGKWMKSFTFVRSSLVTFPWAGTLHKPNASNVISGAIWVGSVETSCMELEERALGGSHAPSGTRSVGPFTAMQLHSPLLPPPHSPPGFTHWCLHLPHSTSAPTASPQPRLGSSWVPSS